MSAADHDATPSGGPDLQALLDYCPDGVLVVEPDGRRILSANDESCRLLGYHPKDLLRLSLEDIQPADARSRVDAALQQLGEGRAHRYSSILLLRKDGRTFAADVSATRIRVDGATRILAFFRDVTARDLESEQHRIKHDLMQALAATDSLDEGLNLSMDAAVSITHAVAGGFFLCDRETGTLNLRVHRGLSPSFARVVARFPPGSPMHRMGEARAPVYTRVSRIASALLPPKMPRNIRTVAAIPLHHHEHLLACLCVASDRQEDMPAATRQTLETIAAGTAQAIERLRAQEALREGEERYRKLFEHACDGLIEIDSATGAFLAANPAAVVLYGAANEAELVGRTVWALSPPRQADGRASEVAARALMVEADGRGFAASEWTHLRLGGGELLANVQLVRIGAQRGRPHLQATVRDITASRRLEEERESALVKYRTLFDTLPLGVTVANRDGRILESNRVAEEMLGLDVDEQRHRYVGGPQWEMVRPDGSPMPPDEYASVRALQERRVVRNVEMGVVKAPGEVTWISVTAAPVRLPEIGVVVAFSDISKRKQEAEALAEREEIFANIISQASDAITVVDGRTLRFIEFNAAAHEGLGYSREEFAEMGVDGIQAEDTAEEVLATMERARKLGSVTYETRHRHRDGSVRHARVSIRMLHIRGRDYMAAVWSDTTDRRQAESREAKDALRTEFLLDLHQRAPQLTDHELYDHVLDRAISLTDSTIGFFHRVSDDQRTVLLTTWSKEALRHCTAAFDTHYPMALAGNWVDCVREQRPVVYNDYPQSPNQRGLPEGHTPLRRFMSMPVIRDGKVLFIFGVGNKPSAYDQDDVAQLQVVANELHKIMTQRAAQAQLRTSEERFRHLVETAFDWVWEVDADWRYVYASPRAHDLLGYSSDEMIGRTMFELMPEPDASRVRAASAAAASAREPLSGVESFVVHRSGYHVALETSGIPVMGPQGELLGYRGMSRDVTERKRLEEQFRQAQKLEAVGQLAGGVAHDFNNIIAAFMMHLGLLKMSPDTNDETRTALRELEHEAGRAAALTRQLLMFSRRSVLALKPLDLNEVVANLLKMLTRLIGEDINLRFDRQTALAPLTADAGLLEQVLVNLVVNARDAMPKGGRITIATGTEEFSDDNQPPPLDDQRRAGTFVCLSVSDNGSGMDAETLRRVFEPFFTTKAPGKGTGLGLATVHGIVAQHKGWVDVESELGRGTTFRVFLPALPGVADADADDTPALDMPRGQEVIMVVEDEAHLRRLITQTLRQLGYRVQEAANGQEAMELWRRCGAEVNLLLTDMIMPEGLTGLELAECLQAQKPDLKVIVASGYSAEVVRAGIPDRKGITYLPKPFSPQRLAESVRLSLD
jgi:two-component system, cell cycle sensor histidine kinase and response regulator CckA